MLSALSSSYMATSKSCTAHLDKGPPILVIEKKFQHFVDYNIFQLPAKC